MTTETPTRTWIRVVFLLVGCALGSGYVFNSRVPEPRHQSPARVSLSWARSGDLVASPGRHRIAAGSLQPGPRGGAVRGRLSLRNPTDVPMVTVPRALGRPGPLDDLLLVRITADGTPVFDGPLGLLRRLQAHPLAVSPGAAAHVQISASLGRTVATRLWAGSSAAVRLEWPTAPLRGGG